MHNAIWHEKKVLVTGASGFKGAYLCYAARDLGARVYATCQNHIDPMSAFSLLGLERTVTTINADITDRQSVYDMINTIEPDLIFHMAAKALVKVGLRDPRRTLDVNIMGTINLIEACRRLALGAKILICSTDHVFGNITPKQLPERGFKEDTRVSYGGGPYDASKAAMELVVRMYHSTYRAQLPSIGITRCANVFGPGDINSGRVIPYFITSARDGGIKLKYRLNGRQFIYISDAIAGYVKAMNSLPEPVKNNGLSADSNANGQASQGSLADDSGQKKDPSPFTPTYHFSIERYPGTSGPYIRMRELAYLIAGHVHGTVDEANSVEYARGENRVQALNCATTRKILKWKPRVGLEDGIERLSRWYDSVKDEKRSKALVISEIESAVSSL